jgi:hypothetical protein
LLRLHQGYKFVHNINIIKNKKLIKKYNWFFIK